MKTAEKREILSNVMLEDDPAPKLWELVDNGLADEIVPELTALRLEQDPIHRHKDVLSHTIAVTAKTRPDLTLRLSALFHDIGKPATRKYSAKGVTFYHHEVVGAGITKKRLRALEYSSEIVRDVSHLVRLSGQFKGYMNGWSDSAVRRYARRAGQSLGLLNELIRSDCTTRNKDKFEDLQAAVSDLEKRLTDLAEKDRLAAERPLLDGTQVMQYLNLEPGPEVGLALKFLMNLKRSEPDLDLEATQQRLQAWWEAQS